MQLGMVGLGRMGGNMAKRLRGDGHEVIGYARDPAVSDVSSLSLRACGQAHGPPHRMGDDPGG
jgi:6-phosphogluconate dehydrogenase (decarboxylating)